MNHRLGVDIGGTFTDFCVFSEATNTVQTLKVLSTPEDPGREVIQGLEQLAERHGIAAGDIVHLTHGTTVGVNTVIQRKGINLCLFTTENFEDVLELARLKMPDPYDLFSRRPPPLVGREKVFGIAERVLADGTVEAPLDEASVMAALAGVRAVGGEGVVVALLHAYRNSVHERGVREILAREAPDLAVVCASEVWPVIREYERTVTAVVAGYVQPRVGRYIGSLQDSLRASGVPAEPMITKSNGGIMSAELAKEQCAQMLLSGTAAGVIGAAHVAAMTDTPETMSFDVGGTSADVAFIRQGEAQYGVGEVVGEFPIYIPTVSVSSIGEGGGSIAHVDSQGVLKVGPESAGSAPGPACYGLGGERATLTDAFAVLGYLGQADLGYSAVQMHGDLARRAVDEIAGKLGLGRLEAAEAVVRVAVSGMFLEVSKLVSRHGIDPRDFTLQAFGGAGPMLACFLARELGMRRVVVPVTPGVLSAFGGLIADVKNDFIRTVYLDLGSAAATAALRDGFAELRREALAWLQDEQAFEGPYRLVHSADLRYRGQSFEIETHIGDEAATAGDVAAIAHAFHDEHRRVYDHADEEAPVQAINLRLVVVGEVAKPVFGKLARGEAPPEPLARLEIFHDGRVLPAPLYDRGALLAGQRVGGPAVVQQDDGTTCVLDGFAGHIDDYGNIILTSGA